MCIYVHACLVAQSCARLFATLWTIACQASLSMKCSRQEYWGVCVCVTQLCQTLCWFFTIWAIWEAPRILEFGLPFCTPGALPIPGVKPLSFVVSCIGREILYRWATWEAQDWVRGFPDDSVVKYPLVHAEHMHSIPDLGGFHTWSN